jgi:hypothetical protein
MRDQPPAADIWLNDAEAASRYPHYQETFARLEAVLRLAQALGVTDQEIASMCATLHARAVAQLRPGNAQMAHVTGVFQQAVRSFMDDLGA